MSAPDAPAGVKAGPSDQPFGTIELHEPKAAEVYVDGKFARDIPSTLPREAGKYYLIVVRAPGRVDWIKRIYVFPGVQTTLVPWP